MRKLFLILTTLLASCFAISAQTQTATPQAASTAAKSTRPPIFRATKDQIIQAQKML